MRRTPLLLLVALGCPVIAIVIWFASQTKAEPARPKDAEPVNAAVVPLTRILMFNTGVGHFEREGVVEGSPRVDLTFPQSDINDLLKSLTVDDGGKPGVVSYDGTDPSETLSSFAANLATNPTFGQLLNQARGEKVEVSLEGGAAGNGPFTGVIVGMESSQEPNAKEVHQLNILTADGVRRLPLERVARFRFLNAAFEEDFRRGLAGLTANPNAQRKNLSLHLRGDGKRKLKVGYVVDNPIWKSSYRLSLEGKDGKPQLQGHAIVQNATEEDWKDVRVVLVSGRPISFSTDLSQTLFVPKPSVTPEVYASLQPPVHPQGTPALGGFGGGFAGGLAGGLGGFQIGTVPSGKAGGNGPGGARLDNEGTRGFTNRYQLDLNVSRPTNRLTYDEWKERREEAREDAKKAGEKMANEATSESIAVDAGTIGEGFRILVDQPVSLPRQRSALLPLQYGAVAMTPISLYNRATHPHFPLQGAKIKNTTGRHLLSGPATVTDADGYVGDCKLPNLQPNEERYISFAMDLGLEVIPEKKASVTVYDPIRIRQAAVYRTSTTTLETKYRLNNRSPKRKSLLLDHVPETNSVVVGKNRPVETAKGVHRFAWNLDPKKVVEEVVTEQTRGEESTYLSNHTIPYLRDYAQLDSTSKAVREALLEIIRIREHVNVASSASAEVTARLKNILAEQERIRTNISHLKGGDASSKKHVEKFDKLEDELEKVRESAKAKADAVAAVERELDEYVNKLDLK